MAARKNAVPALGMNESVSVDVRKIKNGYVCRTSTCDARGNYKSEEYYSPTKPQLPKPEPAPAPKKRTPNRKLY